MKYIFFLSTLIIYLCACHPKTSQHNSKTEEVPTIKKERFPPIPKALIGKEIDTIISYDPVTYEEHIEYILSSELPFTPPSKPQKDSIPTGIDTIVIFFPETIDEYVVIINHDTGQRDTLKLIDLED